MMIFRWLPKIVLLALVAVTVLPVQSEAAARMTFVGKNSTYAKVGLQTGDIVMTVDDKAPSSASEVASLIFAALRVPGTHKMIVQRKGEEITLTFEGN